MHYIFIQQDFSEPVAKVFADLAEHEMFGRITGAHITRIKDGVGDNPNGLGSVRQIKSFPAPSFEETITKFILNEKIEYRVSKGSPVKDHLGCLLFTSIEGGTRLEYSIEFEPKLAIPLWGKILKLAIQTPIQKGLKKYAKLSR